MESLDTYKELILDNEKKSLSRIQEKRNDFLEYIENRIQEIEKEMDILQEKEESWK